MELYVNARLGGARSGSASVPHVGICGSRHDHLGGSFGRSRGRHSLSGHVRHVRRREMKRRCGIRVGVPAGMDAAEPRGVSFHPMEPLVTPSCNPHHTSAGGWPECLRSPST